MAAHDRPVGGRAAGAAGAGLAAPAAAMAGSLSWLYLVAALLAPITILAPHHPGTWVPGVAAVGATALVLGVVLRAARRRVPTWCSEALLALGTLLTGVAIHVTDGVPNSASLLFLWVALYAAYFLSRRRALAHVVLIGACYAAVIALQPPPFPPVAHWATTMVSTLVAVLIVGSLKARVDRLIERVAERADALARSEHETRLIVDTSQHAYVAFERDGRVVEWNAAAEAAFGWTREQALGASVESLIVPDVHRDSLRRVLGAFAAAAGSVPAGRHEAVARTRDGRTVPVEVSLSVLPRAGGPVVSAFLSDISERRRMEEDRARERRFLDTVLEALDTGVVACDADGELVLSNRATRELHGLPLDAVPAERWAEVHRLFEADGRTPLSTQRVPLVRAFAGEDVTDTEVVVERADGEQRTVVCTGSAIVDAAGRRQGAVVAMTDVTARKAAERVAARHMEALRRVGDVSRALAGAHDAQAVVDLACAAARELTGAGGAAITTAAAAGGERTVLARAGAPGDDGAPVDADARTATIPGTGRPQARIELHGVPADLEEGRWELVQVLAADAGSALERVALLARLEDAARRDELTGLPNRRVWEEQLPRELARARRDGRPFAVAMLDVDFFKRYNDEHGHQAGDRLLARAALRWTSELRPTDLLARYGGEEFGLVLPGCTADEAVAIVDRLRAATPSGQTCSAGIAVWDFEEDAAAVVARADAALYAAKSAGRDRSTVAGPV